MKKEGKKTIKNSHSLQETFDFGFAIGKLCQGGEVFLLNGDLGAGKTSFLQGLGSGLGIKTRINSPTFNILKLYKARASKDDARLLNFCHIDAYRLNSGKDLENIGLSDYLEDKKTVTAIEWADRVKSIWPKSYTKINLEISGEETRRIILELV